MPFTTSHPAIVLPLKTIWPRYFSLTGLMAGAMAPDLLYFLIATTVPRGVSHSWSGLFLFCLPAGALFGFAFHWLFKYHFIRNLPSPFDRRLSGLAASRWKPNGLRWWLVYLSSIIVGILSHFLWDACTHAEGEIAHHFPLLHARISILNLEVHIVSIMQHASTVLGAVAIVVYAVKGTILPEQITDNVSRSQHQKLWFWLGIGISSALFAVGILIFYSSIFPSLEIRLVNTLGLGSWAGMFWTVVLYSSVRWLRRH
ncbi:MAG: DUF4184 family protein [candidate division Zixibacteria bacterium]|nr:DUF4184 family protein [candidate division Zixibacteria bacterium]